MAGSEATSSTIIIVGTEVAHSSGMCTEELLTMNESTNHCYDAIESMKLYGKSVQDNTWKNVLLFVLFVLFIVIYPIGFSINANHS